MAKSARTDASHSSIDMIARASRGEPPQIARMPRPTMTAQIAMRDGVRLATWVWLPFDREGPYPTILFRTPYQEPLLGWARLGALAYRDAGYAVVFQLIRGVGGSEGCFTFSDPCDRTDGYDTIGWIADQPWSDSNVGMDGSSYGAMTQMAAACAAPPALKCIIPAVISSDYFRHVPRFGGVFSRQHSLGWTELVQADSLTELTPGLWGDASLLSAPAAWQRLLSRPAIDAADGVLREDRLQHYRDVLNHARFDDFWAARTLGPDDYARIAIPTMVVTGLFDGTMGSQHIWTMLERHAPANVERWFVLGPWDHGQAYVGGESRMGPWQFDATQGIDLPSLRLAFFDRHLRGEGPGPSLPGRATCFVNGARRWTAATAYPHPAQTVRTLHLSSDGFANMHGHGRLLWDTADDDAPADSFRNDPALPFVPVGALLDPELALDLRERERLEDVLVYTTAPLDAPLTLHGAFELSLTVACDTPDCDIMAWLAVIPADGQRTTMLSQGMLRLRYREGFDREVPLTPGEPTAITIEMQHVGHQLAGGERLRLLIGSGLFPLCDPNTNTGDPVATAVALRTAQITIFHDAARPSFVRLPILADPQWSDVT